MRCVAPPVPHARGVLQEAGDRSARSFLALVGVDLGEDHQAERLRHVSAGLSSNLGQLVAKPCRRIPPTRADLHPRQEEQARREAGAELRSRLGDQLSPELAGLAEVIRAPQLVGESDARIVFTGLPPVDRDGTVEEVATDVPHAPEVDVGDRREAFDECVGLVEVLGQCQPCFCPTQSSFAFPAVSAHGRLPREGAEDGGPLASTDARLGKCTLQQVHRDPMPLALTSDGREVEERFRSERAWLSRVCRFL
jgi:hypothetical protein